jgi:hypothetical protein
MFVCAASKEICMPQNEPNQSDAFEETPPRPSVAQPPTSEQTGIQILPLLRGVSIRALRTTVRGLEGAINKLEADTSAGATLPISPKLQTQIRSGWNRVVPFLKNLWQRFVPLWAELVTQIRTRLPENVSQTLNDRALSSIVAGALIVLLWTTSSLFSSKPPTKVAVAPLPTERTAPKKNTPVSKPIQPEFGSPAPISIPTDLTAPEPEKPAISPEPIAEKPSEPVIVEPAPEVAVPEPEKPEAPIVPLTPEQTLIASIQDQVVTITDPYSSGLIESIKPSFSKSRLSVLVNDGWYGLNRSQQDKLGDELLKRSQELDFSNLEITDRQGMVLARSPVVGSTMVILKRKADAV